jgi:hypothetical protein
MTAVTNAIYIVYSCGVQELQRIAKERIGATPLFIYPLPDSLLEDGTEHRRDTMQLLELVALLRQIGYVVLAKLLLNIVWFVTPFFVWLAIGKLTGKSFFVPTYAIPGTILVVALCILWGVQVYFITYFEFGLMKRVEHCGQIFQNPADPDISKKYSEECEKLVLPYVYHYPLMMSGRVRDALASRRLFVLEAAGSLYMSYSLSTLVASFQLIPNALALLSANAPQISSLAMPILSWTYANLTWILVVLVLLTFCFDVVRFRPSLRAFGVSTYRAILSSAMLPFGIDRRLAYLSMLIARIPVQVKRDYIAKYKPFVEPSALPQIIQMSVFNIEQKPCSVTSFSSKFATEADAERVLKLFRRDRRMPTVFRAMAPTASRQLMEMTENSHPVFYLGTLNDRCLLIGIATYIPSQKVREGIFYFDNIHIRREFMLITSKAIERQRSACCD